MFEIIFSMNALVFAKCISHACGSINIIKYSDHVDILANLFIPNYYTVYYRYMMCSVVCIIQFKQLSIFYILLSIDLISFMFLLAAYTMNFIPYVFQIVSISIFNLHTIDTPANIFNKRIRGNKCETRKTEKKEKIEILDIFSFYILLLLCYVFDLFHVFFSFSPMPSLSSFEEKQLTYTTTHIVVSIFDNEIWQCLFCNEMRFKLDIFYVNSHAE